MKQNPTRPSVAVLMCTLQGERFLVEQLESIRTQQGVDVQLWVSDDGSTDNTTNIIKQYQKDRDIDLTIVNGPRKGFAANFLSLVCRSEIQADYYAYSDQDDIWEPDKLTRAIELIRNEDVETPILYCSRTRLVDESGNELGFSPLFKKPPCFANALMQNIGGGNTMVMNKTARLLLVKAGEKDIIAHDWWTYLLVSGAGGIVIYDSHPGVRYRQHEHNILGSNMEWSSRMARIRLLFRNQYKEWNDLNVHALLKSKHLLTNSNLITLKRFCSARKTWQLPRIYLLTKAKVYRQTLLGNLGLVVAVLLNKL